ncbi:MAG TPA: membrane protein insertase YidC [Thermoanaerobaculia bacterium]|nr:membrane protein insertase YidC [Thermoanaerobaculia bacterium]
METKRLVIAFALSAAVLIGWYVLFPPPPPAKPAAPAAAKTASAPAPAASAPAPAPAVTAAAPAAAPAPPPAAAAVHVEPIGAGAEESVEVREPLFTARLSNEGGVLTSFVLLQHKDGAGKPLDLVRQGAPFPGRTLGLDEADAFLARAAKARWAVSKEDGNGDEKIVRFRYREADGNGLTRTYVFRNSYVVVVKVEREGAAGPVGIVLGPSIGNPLGDELTSRYSKPGATITVAAGGSVTRRAKDGLKEPLVGLTGLTAAGLEDNYFLSAFLPGAQGAVSLRPVALSAAAPAPGATPDASATPAAGPKPDGESEVVLSGPSPLATDVFLGPKAIDILEKTRPGLDRVIDYGWFAVLVKPLLWGLREIHKFVGNWGVAILLITVVIKVLLYPLTHKQLVSMKKMGALQPKVEAIRTKWGSRIKQDPQARVKMNEEMMGLYKQEGVNPAGGCLPLLLQMPILIAFYNLLAHSIELRHAPFMLWITDLSAKDPYYVTPILMTATMWIQQQMTPTTGDPAMKRVQNIMPLVMGFLFKDVPSGLVLYWLMQNILTIGQQMLLNRFTDLGPSSMKPKAS